MNAQQAIARSVSRTEIVHLDYDWSVLQDLYIAADDYVEAGVTELWGSDDDGAEWRIHMRDEARADYDVCS